MNSVQSPSASRLRSVTHRPARRGYTRPLMTERVATAASRAPGIPPFLPLQLGIVGRLGLLRARGDDVEVRPRVVARRSGCAGCGPVDASCGPRVPTTSARARPAARRRAGAPRSRAEAALDERRRACAAPARACIAVRAPAVARRDVVVRVVDAASATGAGCAPMNEFSTFSVLAAGGGEEVGDDRLAAVGDDLAAVSRDRRRRSTGARPRTPRYICERVSGYWSKPAPPASVVIA